MTSGASRYQIKREAGISSTRTDGSVCTELNDVEAASAEKYAADFMGCEYNDTVSVTGDGGHDFVFPLTVEVIWLGCYKGTEEPRQSGHLIVNPYERHRWADIYVVVKGNEINGYDIVGWTTHTKLANEGLKNFGYGDKYAMKTDKLEPISRLMKLKER